MNLVGHVAVALAPGLESDDEFLVGCLVPDVAAIARVRLTGPRDGTLARGIAFHHACDAAFHDSPWFRARSRALRDDLVARAVESGPARACAHAGLEMVLDGALVRDDTVERATRGALDALAELAPSLGGLVPPAASERWVAVAARVGRTLDPSSYTDAYAVAQRLVHMTAGRRRIELPVADTDVVADALARQADACEADAPAVVAAVRAAATA